MKIKFHTNILNDLINTKEIGAPDDSTLKQLFQNLIQEHGEAVRGRIFENDKLRPEVLVLLNGKSIGSLDDPDIILRNDDFLAVITTIVGG